MVHRLDGVLLSSPLLDPRSPSLLRRESWHRTRHSLDSRGLGIWTLIDFLWILVGTFKDKKRASSRKLVTGLLVEGYPNTGDGVTHLSNACPAREDADDDRADGDTTDEFVDFIRVAMQSFGIDPDAWLEEHDRLDRERAAEA